MKIELLKQILMVAVASSIISTSIIQKIKEQLKNKKILFIISLLVSLIIGTTFCLSFTELTFIDSLWVGVASWVGADALYKTFEDKFFKSFKNIEKIIEIKRDDKNEI